jgi:hypothetical protein
MAKDFTNQRGQKKGRSRPAVAAPGRGIERFLVAVLVA